MKNTLSILAFSLLFLSPLSATEEAEEASSKTPFYFKGQMSTELLGENKNLESKHVLNTSFGHKNRSTYSELGLALDARIKNDSSCSLVSVSRALTIPKIVLGVNILKSEDMQLSVELSRRPLQEIFDSKVLFPGTVPGIHAKYSMDRLEGKLTVKQGFFANYGVTSVTQLSLEDINQTGAYATFSLIAPIKSTARCFQSIFGYKGDVFNIPFHSYIAGYWIMDRHLNSIDCGYAGVKFGDAKAAKDWSLDICAKALKPIHREYGVFSTITYYAKDNLCLTQEQSWMKPFKSTFKIKHLF